MYAKFELAKGNNPRSMSQWQIKDCVFVDDMSKNKIETAMESSEDNLIKANQHEIKTMLEERIMRPKKYTDRPLLLWRANIDDVILRNMFFNFEPCVKERIHEQSQLFLNSKGENQINAGKEDVAIPRWIPLKLDKLKEKAFFNPDKWSNPYRVFCFFLEFPEENLTTPFTYKEYSDFINRDWLIREKECLNAPIVVFLPFVEMPEAFKGYDQCVYIPDFEEWKVENSRHDGFLINHLIGFLESFTSKEERDYRWYWYFQRQMDGKGSSDLKSKFDGKGCDFPSCWMEGIFNLRRHFILPMAQIPKNYVAPKPVKISEIPVDMFKEFFKQGISEDVVEDFRHYLIAHNVEIQGNKRNQ